MSCDENLKYVSLIGDSWNVPLVSVGSRGDELRNGRLRPMKYDKIYDDSKDFSIDDWNWKILGDRRTLVRIGPTTYRLADAVLSFMRAKNFTDITLVRLKDSPKERTSQSHHASPIDVKTPHDCHLYATAIKNYYDILDTGYFPERRENQNYRKKAQKCVNILNFLTDNHLLLLFSV